MYSKKAQEAQPSPAQKNILIINRSISLQPRNADCDNYKINLPNSQFSISFIESRPSELELSLNPSEQDQRFRSESKRERPTKPKSPWIQLLEEAPPEEASSKGFTTSGFLFLCEMG